MLAYCVPRVLRSHFKFLAHIYVSRISNDVNIQASFACNYSLGTIFMVNVVHPTQLDSVVAWLVVLVVCGVDIAQ